MLIDPETCIGCGSCAPYCPMEAIIVHKKDKVSGRKAYAEIDRDECVECAVCHRAGVCPTDAVVREELEMPRVMRAFFSDPWFSHPGTDIPGRGTEEMKTNEVTGRFGQEQIGFGLEFGRPGIGCRLKETEPAIAKLTSLGITLEPNNPLTQLVEDPVTGRLRDDVRDEKVLSAIVEAVTPLSKAQDVLHTVIELSKQIDTVFSLGVISTARPNGEFPHILEMQKAGINPSINGKTNPGLGRPLYQPKKLKS